MRYLLKNKNKVVLSFEIIELEENFEGISNKFLKIKNIEIFEPQLLPHNLELDNVEISLEKWITKRKVPKNREFVHKILATLGKLDNPKNFMAYIDISLGLSLNDSFWIIPAEADYKWEDYNLYNNAFDETLALVAFTGYSTRVKGLTTSPEFTTNGMLKKCWHRNENGDIELIKGQTEFNGLIVGREALAEYYSSQIAEILGFNHIKYEIKMFHNQLVNYCSLFTSENIGYLPIAYCIKEKIDYDNNSQLFPAIIKIYGKEAFQDLLLFDAIICNTDRHLGNFGMLINNDTNQIVSPAPIFDNGASIFNYLRDNDKIDELLEERLSWFQLNFEEQAKYAGQRRHIQSLSKLSNFKFIRHSTYNLEENLLQKIEKFIQVRSQKIIHIIQN